MPFFEHDGLRFHYAEAGAGQPFIFQHGLGGDTAQSLGLLRPPPGTRLIAFDCRGHGQTAARATDRLTFEALASDWLALMDHLGQEGGDGRPSTLSEKKGASRRHQPVQELED